MAFRSFLLALLVSATSVGPAVGQAIDISTLGYNQGSERAPLRVVEFGDFGCTHCRNFHLSMFPTLKEEYIDTGLVTWKYIPVAFTTFPRSEIAALASECAADQGLFFAMRDALYLHLPDWQRAEDPAAALTVVAEEAGLNINRFRECLAVERGRETIETNSRIAMDSGVRTTPTFLILGREMVSLPGVLPIRLFREVLDQALADLGGGPPPEPAVQMASLEASPAPRPSAALRCPATPGQVALNEMNRIREEAGMGQLSVDVRLVESAAGHSTDMARESFFSHEGSDGSSVGERAKRAGFEWRVIGENIFAGYDDPLRVVEGWMDSPPHREMILTPSVTHVGIAYIHRPFSRLKEYWTANFGTPLGASRPTPDGCHP